MLGLLERAERGEWSHVDARLRNADILSTDLKWAIYGASIESLGVQARRFAAALLNISDLPLSDEDMRFVEGWMAEEDDNVVRLRLAIALYARGSKWPKVWEYFEEALS